MIVVGLVEVKLDRESSGVVANHTSCESCGLHHEDLLVLFVRCSRTSSTRDQLVCNFHKIFQVV